MLSSIGEDIEITFSNFTRHMAKNGTGYIGGLLILNLVFGLAFGVALSDTDGGIGNAPTFMRWSTIAAVLEVLLAISFGILLLLWQPCKWIRLNWRHGIRMSHYTHNDPKIFKKPAIIKEDSTWDKEKN